MATTTNYNWTTPDDTDLVKDGASAIRTLGSSIDTTTKALNPSTTLGDIEYRFINLVILTSYLQQPNGWEAFMGYAVSGATTISATTAKCLQMRMQNSGNANIQASMVDSVTLTAGSNTFTAKYASASGTATFQYREITVIDLGS
jgi:hypothetical protein